MATRKTSPIKKDARGIYAVTNGAKYRPGGLPGHDHAYDMDDMGLKEGDRVWIRHISQTALARVTRFDPERTVVWGINYLHECAGRFPRSDGEQFD